MRYLEVRRHAMRNQPGAHLSQAGVNLARRLGQTMGPFALVVTSALPRALETAIAMGFAVDRQYDELSQMWAEVDDEIAWPASFAEYAEAVKRGGATARFARQQAELWRSLARQLPDAASALVITHGGIVEIGAVACLPRADHSAWGPHCDYCEGLRLSFDGQDFVAAQILRVNMRPKA